MKGLVTVQRTSLSSVMVAASSLTLPEIVVVFEEIFESSDLVEDWARATEGNRSAAPKAKRESFFMGTFLKLENGSGNARQCKAEISGVKSEERIGTIQNHEEIRPDMKPTASGGKAAEQAVFFSDFEFQVYLARNASDHAIPQCRRTK